MAYFLPLVYSAYWITDPDWEPAYLHENQKNKQLCRATLLFTLLLYLLRQLCVIQVLFRQIRKDDIDTARVQPSLKKEAGQWAGFPSVPAYMKPIRSIIQVNTSFIFHLLLLISVYRIISGILKPAHIPQAAHQCNIRKILIPLPVFIEGESLHAPCIVKIYPSWNQSFIR